MELNINQRKRLAQLYDSYLALPESERQDWLTHLTGDDAGLRDSLGELLAARSEVLRRDFLNTPAVQNTTQVHTSVHPTELDYRLEGSTGANPTPVVGMVLDHRFELLEELGRGGMGCVFKARDKLGDERNPFVAVKVLNEGFKLLAGADSALRRETDRSRLMAHPNVITVREFNIDEQYGFAYMTMEYLRGRTLDALLKAQGKAGLPFNEAWEIIEQIGRALANGHSCRWEDDRGVHTGIVHMDLKPANVFLCQDGRVKVLDFGIARPMLTPGSQAQTTLFGKGLRALTPEYASLEMWKGETPDPRDDIYAFGCICYELLTGRHPFAFASAPDALAGDLKPLRPEGLSGPQWQALRHALEFHRAKRIPSVTKFLLELRPRSWIERQAVPLAVAVLLAILGAVALGYRHMLNESAGMDEPAPPHVELTAAQKSFVDDLIARARDRFADVDITAQPEQLSYVLSDGLDNVDELTRDVLETQPDNAAARELRSSVAALYAAKAHQLLESGGPANSAFRLIENGLAVAGGDRALRGLQKDLCEHNTTACQDATP